MFGMLAPCPSRTPDDLKPRWMGHFCGLCLELRDDAGQLARLTTNYDALALSVLVEAQQGDESDSRNAGPCALRGMRRQRIATGGGPRLAATASLLLASAKIRDHVEDGDGIAARRGARGSPGLTADRLRTKATAIGDSIDLPTEPLVAMIERQREIEAGLRPGHPADGVTAPTEAPPPNCSRTRRSWAAARRTPGVQDRRRRLRTPGAPARRRRGLRRGRRSAGRGTRWPPPVPGSKAHAASRGSRSRT